MPRESKEQQEYETKRLMRAKQLVEKQERMRLARERRAEWMKTASPTQITTYKKTLGW